MEELEMNLTSFQYLPVFSREVPENREHLIRTGYVHAVFEEICKRKKNLPKTGTEDGIYAPAFYLCGWKVMIDEAKKRITDLGFDRKSIHLELYG
jgi:Na+-transporting NADH:ubiquinone oxidoreductase subunit NqrF